MLAFHSPDTPAQRSIPYSSVHKFQVALAPGDILVLTTDERDEEHKLREKLYPVSLIHIEQVDSSWRAISDSRQTITIQENPTRIHKHLSLAQLTPAKTIKNHKGECTIFVANVAHGYRLHFLDFIKNRLPEIYAQLNLN